MKENDKDLLRIIASILLPPLGVFMQVGISAHFWINLILLFVVPYVGALIHALYVITAYKGIEKE